MANTNNNRLRRNNSHSSLQTAHETRLAEARDRFTAFTRRVARFTSDLAAECVRYPVALSCVTEIRTNHRYRVDGENDHLMCTFVSQPNIAGWGNLYKAYLPQTGPGTTTNRREPLLCRLIDLDHLSAGAYNRLRKSLAIAKLLTTNIPTTTAATTTTTTNSPTSDRTGIPSKYYSTHFIAIRDIFLVADQSLHVFCERFAPQNSLQHFRSNGDCRVSVVKQIIAQLGDAVAHLQMHGVAHRFIRAENVLLNGSSTINNSNSNSASANSGGKDSIIPFVKLAAFDFACMFWDAGAGGGTGTTESGNPLLCTRRTLGIVSLPLEAYDHLPPEAFADNYDCSMIDVWSVGVIGCLLLAGENPFFVTKIDGTDASGGTKISQWRDTHTFEPVKALISDEMRSLLGDIFVDADARMSAHDLIRDKRLQESCTPTVFARTASSVPYYRIDVHKNININEPKFPSSGRQSLADTSGAATATRTADDYSQSCAEILELRGFKETLGEHDIASTYRLVRDGSGTIGTESEQQWYANGEYGERFVRAQIVDTSAPQSTICAVAKIVLAGTVPLRHLHQILGESSKIIRFLSDSEQYSRYVHRVHDIFRVSDGHVYIFLDDITGWCSLHQLMCAASENASTSSPTLASSSTLFSPHLSLTYETICRFASQLATVTLVLAWHGVSHRYIRPEYIFIAPSFSAGGGGGGGGGSGGGSGGGEQIKLTHFELACFSWNAKTSSPVRRGRAIQDEREYRWDHLPPECFDTQYDAYGVDVWSVGVLITLMIASSLSRSRGSNNNNNNNCNNGINSRFPPPPFTVPHVSIDSALKQWREYRDSMIASLHQASSSSSSRFTNFIPLLDRIFTAVDTRIQPKELINRVRDIDSFGINQPHQQQQQQQHQHQQQQQQHSRPKSVAVGRIDAVTGRRDSPIKHIGGTIATTTTTATTTAKTATTTTTAAKTTTATTAPHVSSNKKSNNRLGPLRTQERKSCNTKKPHK